MSNIVNLFGRRAVQPVPRIPVEVLGSVLGEYEVAAALGVRSHVLAAWRENGVGPLWVHAIGVAGGIAYPARLFYRWLDSLPRAHAVPQLPTDGIRDVPAKQPRAGSMWRRFDWRTVQSGGCGPA